MRYKKEDEKREQMQLPQQDQSLVVATVLAGLLARGLEYNRALLERAKQIVKDIYAN